MIIDQNFQIFNILWDLDDYPQIYKNDPKQKLKTWRRARNSSLLFKKISIRTFRIKFLKIWKRPETFLRCNILPKNVFGETPPKDVESEKKLAIGRWSLWWICRLQLAQFRGKNIVKSTTNFYFSPILNFTTTTRNFSSNTSCYCRLIFRSSKCLRCDCFFVAFPACEASILMKKIFLLVNLVFQPT